MEASPQHILFYSLLALVVNSYLFYPALIIIIAMLKRTPSRINENEKLPKVSILISAFNEEKVIAERINNIASLDYDFNKLDVLIGSDNSSDQTNDILKRASENHSWLRVFIFDERNGKAGVLNKLINEVYNDIIVFTDANTVFEKSALKKLCSGFSSSDVGGVSGRLILGKAGHENIETNEEAVYWKWETFIKMAEGKLGILIGANGGIFAIRKKLFHEIPTVKAVTDDFFLSLSVLADCYKFDYCSEAIAYEDVGKSLEEEFRRKVRFAATNFQTLAYFNSLLIPKNILLSYSFWSHKVIRWFAPVILALLLVINGTLFGSSIFLDYCLFLQLAFYAFALVGFIMYKLKIRVRLFSYPFFFVMSNIALLKGLKRFLKKEHSVIWKTTIR